MALPSDGADAARAPLASVRRNGPCSCGSGQRYKRCCGRPDGERAGLWETMHAALADQQRGRYDEAAGRYEAVLAAWPDLADAVHMLGVARLQQHRYADATPLLVRAAQLTHWRSESVLHNLGLALAGRLARSHLAHAIALWARHAEWTRGFGARAPVPLPRVSVIVPSYNHARFVAEALGFVASHEGMKLHLSRLESD